MKKAWTLASFVAVVLAALAIAPPTGAAQRRRLLPCARTNVPTLNARAEARGRYSLSGDVTIEGVADTTRHMCRPVLIFVTPVRDGAPVESETQVFEGAFATRAPRIRFNVRGLDAGSYRVQLLVDRGNERPSAGDMSGYYAEGATTPVIDAASATPVALEGRRRRVSVRFQVTELEPVTVDFTAFGLQWAFDEVPRQTTDGPDRITVALPACDLELRRRTERIETNESSAIEARLAQEEGFVRFTAREHGGSLGYSYRYEARTSDGSTVERTITVRTLGGQLYELHQTDRGGRVVACPFLPGEESFPRQPRR